ncbi:hypothetical protein BT69DRAFT_268540 [Atractiella rhizophila]|nr:hypothetical protein BT69DRAFT_268540 [Atractiella rhizophila]
MLSHTARREITSHLSLERERGSYDCYDCKAGRYELCPSIKFAASPPFDGTLQGFYNLRRLACKLQDVRPIPCAPWIIYCTKPTGWNISLKEGWSGRSLWLPKRGTYQ